MWTNKEQKKRNNNMLRWRREGVSVIEISKRVKLSRERVYQILNRLEKRLK